MARRYPAQQRTTKRLSLTAALRSDRRQLIKIAALSVLAAGSMVFGIAGYQAMVSGLIEGSSMVAAVGVQVVAQAVGSAAASGARISGTKLKRSAARYFGRRVFPGAVRSLGKMDFDRRLGATTGDMDKAMRAVSGAVPTLMADSCVAVASTAAMLFLSGPMSMIMAGGLAVSVGSSVVASRRAGRLSDAHTRTSDHHAVLTSERLAPESSRAIVNHGYTDAATETYLGSLDAVARVETRTQRFSERFTAVSEAGYSAATYSLLTMIGTGASLLSGTPVANVLAFMTASAFMLAPISRMPGHVLQVLEARRSVSNMQRVVDAGRRPQFPRPSLRPQHNKGSEVSLQRVSVHHGTHPAVRNFSMSAGAGQVVMLRGPNGSGKSSVGRVIDGTLPPTSGTVAFDGVDVSESADRRIAVMPQRTQIFSGISIADNVALGNRSASRRDVERVCRRVGLHSVIASRNRGYDTIIEPGKAGFSGGEARRIDLARMLLNDNNTYFLDEPTSEADTVSQRTIARVLREEANAGATVIVADHNPEIWRISDWVYDLAPRTRPLQPTVPMTRHNGHQRSTPPASLTRPFKSSQ